MQTLNAQLDRVATEIARRSTTQQAIQAGNLTAVSALAGVVIAGRTGPLLLLLVPVVCLTLASQWLDHHRCIQDLGSYAAERVEPRLIGLLPESASFQLWEAWTRQSERPQEFWAWRAPILVLFHGVALVALAVCIPSVPADPSRNASAGLGAYWVWPTLVGALELALTIGHGLYFRGQLGRRTLAPVADPTADEGTRPR